MNDKRIQLAHGDGGLLTHELISEMFLKHFGNRDPDLDESTDAAIFPVQSGRMALTTDSFVVSPLFFPGGDIGKLAVCGTVNDLAVSGATPQFLSAAFILEEGLEMDVLERITASMASEAQAADVRIVTGDTKVVERGLADKVYINTAGIGFMPPGIRLGNRAVRPGDVLIINGSIGAHGIAVLARREGLSLQSPVVSDCAALNHLTEELLRRFTGVRWMRDPTRGGLATTAKELALGCRLDVCLFEQAIPISSDVAGAADLLGLDPLYLANEGKVLIVAAPEEGEAILSYLRSHPLGHQAAIIGEVWEGTGDAYLQSALGGTRYLDMLTGQQLPRIC